MTIKIINNNVVINYGENIMSAFSIDSIEEKIVEIYSAKNPSPVSSKFPNIANILAPEVQVAVLFQNNSSIISDQNIGSLEHKDNQGLIRLVHAIKTLVNKRIIAYGYNFIYELEDTNFDFFSSRIKEKFFRQDVDQQLPADTEFKYALPNIVFNYDNAKVNLIINADKSNPQGDETNRVLINVNFHHMDTTRFPNITNLKDDYVTKEAFIKQYINSIFS